MDTLMQDLGIGIAAPPSPTIWDCWNPVHRRTRRRAHKSWTAYAMNWDIVTARRFPMDDPQVARHVKSLKRPGRLRQPDGRADALGKIGTPAIPALVELLKDWEKSFVRVSCRRIVRDNRRPVYGPGSHRGDETARMRGFRQSAGDATREDWHSREFGPHGRIERWGIPRLFVFVPLRRSGTSATRLPSRPLITALRDEGAGVRLHAAEALGKIRDTTAIPALIESLRDNDGDVRIRVVEGLRRIGMAAVPALIEALRDKVSPHRGPVAVCLGGNPRQLLPSPFL